MVRCSTCNVFHMRKICRFFYCCAWFDTAVSKRQEVRWCSFDWSFPLSIGNVWESTIDRAISIHSCSYFIWNRYCPNHRRILPNFLLFVWFDTVEINRLPCSNNKIYDDAIFTDGLRYQLTMFEVCILIGLSRLLDTHITYEIFTGNWHHAGIDPSCRTVVKR